MKKPFEGAALRHQVGEVQFPGEIRGSVTEWVVKVGRLMVVRPAYWQA